MYILIVNTLQKKVLYKSKYRGTKEGDRLIGGFVNKNLNKFDEYYILKLLDFLELNDQDILNMAEGNKPINQDYQHILDDIIEYKKELL